jgi:hypothetical protein
MLSLNHQNYNNGLMGPCFLQGPSVQISASAGGSQHVGKGQVDDRRQAKELFVNGIAKLGCRSSYIYMYIYIYV